ncbi:GTPase [Stenotrophomonas maltophilia]|uniref:GTPase n=1 Tax=Stenotrophomonas maltophilia TaxID=40324 RepID=UPI0039C1785E
MSIAYTNYVAELEAISTDARRLIGACNHAEEAQITARIDEALEQTTAQSPLRIAFIGEWNAGKSSLIAALTGAEVAIDADVCTDVSAEFSWKGLTVVDTPGIQAQRHDTDHDHISRQATIGADLVLFVVTNELFNPRLAAHLRFVLDEEGLGLARKAALVVNKFDRESNQEEVLLGEVRSVLGPHQNVPIFFVSSRKFLQSGSAPSELRERFVLQSRLPALTKGIDRFVEDAGTLGRLETPLQVVADAVESLLHGVANTKEDEAQLELIRRQKTVLQGLERNLRDIRKTWKQQAHSTVNACAEGAVQNVSETSTSEDLDRLFETTMAVAVADVERLHDGVTGAIEGAMEDAEQKLVEIGQSPLGKQVEKIDIERAKLVTVNFDQSRPGEKAYLGRMGKMATDPLKQALDAASNNAKGLGELVYKVGKTLGKKFRPWGAVNAGKTLAKCAGRAAKFVPLASAGLDFYVQYREETAKDEQARHFANMRLALRGAFAEQARMEADVLEDAINSVSQGSVAAALAKLDAQAAQIAANNESATRLAGDITALMQRCTQLRSRLSGELITATSVQ